MRDDVLVAEAGIPSRHTYLADMQAVGVGPQNEKGWDVFPAGHGPASIADPAVHQTVPARKPGFAWQGHLHGSLAQVRPVPDSSVLPQNWRLSTT